MRAIDWVDGRVIAIEQTLPDVLTPLWIETVDQLIDAIERLAIHGARALGVADARGVALAVGNGGDIRVESAGLRAARPTAMNLAWGVNRVLVRLDAVVLSGGPTVIAKGLCDAVVIEIRDPSEIVRDSATIASNYDFDITPADLVTLLTDERIFHGKPLG